MTDGPQIPPAGQGGVCVVGGGLAGIAAALRLLDAGLRVTLLEARPRLGGATYSFRRDGLLIDTGQHVFLRGFERYRELLARLGSADRAELQPRLTVPVLVPGRPVHRLTRWRLPAPAHLLPALAGYRPLRPVERLAAIRAASALRAVDPDAPATDQRRLGDWLAEHGQRPQVIRRLWGPIAVAALNIGVEQASLGLAARVFQHGLLSNAAAGDLGRPSVPLQELHGGPAVRLLRRLGGSVHTRARVRWIQPAGGDGTAGRATGGFTVGVDGHALAAAAVVLAVPHQVASQLVPAAAAPAAGSWHRLGSSPIVNVHLRYATPVTDLPFVAAVDSPTQWVFDRSVPELGGEQYLVVSLSAADELVDRPSAELIAEQRAALAALFPAAAQTPVRSAFVTREPYATFRQAAGNQVWRPPSATCLPGLALAGAWTDTGWPDTMEGAVRSGHAAADVIAAQLAPGASSGATTG